MDASFKAANEIYAEIAASNADFKKVYDALVAFRGDQYLWWQVAEYGFDSFMIRARTPHLMAPARLKSQPAEPCAPGVFLLSHRRLLLDCGRSIACEGAAAAMRQRATSR